MTQPNPGQTGDKMIPVYAVGVESVLGENPKIVFESVFSLKHSGRVQDLIMHAVQEMAADKFALIEAPMRHCLEIAVLALWMHYRKGESSKCLEIETGFDGKYLAGMVSGFLPPEYGDLKNPAASTPQAASLTAFLQTLAEQSQKLIVRHNLTLGHIQILFRFDLEALDAVPTGLEYLSFATPQDPAAKVQETQALLEKEPLGEVQRLLAFQSEEQAEDLARGKVQQRFESGEGTPLEERLKEETSRVQGGDYESPLEDIEVLGGGDDADGEVTVSGSYEEALGSVAVKGSKDAALGKVKVAGAKKKNVGSVTRVTGQIVESDDEETVVAGGEDGEDEELTRLTGGFAAEDTSQTRVKGSKQGERKTVLKGGTQFKDKTAKTLVQGGEASDQEDETVTVEGGFEDETQDADGTELLGAKGRNGAKKGNVKTLVKGGKSPNTKDKITVVSSSLSEDDDDENHDQHLVMVDEEQDGSQESEGGGILSSLIEGKVGTQAKGLKKTNGKTAAKPKSPPPKIIVRAGETPDDPDADVTILSGGTEDDLSDEVTRLQTTPAPKKKPKLSSRQLIERIKKRKTKLSTQDQELVNVLEQMQNSDADLEEEDDLLEQNMQLGAADGSAAIRKPKKASAQEVLLGIQELIEVEELEAQSAAENSLAADGSSPASLDVVTKKTEAELLAVQENTDHFAKDLDTASQGFSQVLEKAKTVLERVQVPDKLREYLQKMFEDLSKNRAELEHKTRDIVNKWKKAQLEFKVTQTMLQTELQKKDGLLRQKESNIEKSKQVLANTLRSLEDAREQLRGADKKDVESRDARMKVIMEKNQTEVARVTQRMDMLKQRLNTEAAQRTALTNENGQLGRKVLALQEQLKGSEKWKTAANQEPQLKAELDRVQRQIEDVKKQNKMLQDKLSQSMAAKTTATGPSKAKENSGEPSGGELKLKLEQQTKLYQKVKEDFDRVTKRLEESKQAETKLRVELSKVQADLKNSQKNAARQK